MIHRFLENFPQVEARDMIWNIRRVTGGTDRTFAMGKAGTSTLADYLGKPQVAVSQYTIDYPDLAPNGQWYTYWRTDNSAPATDPHELRLGYTDEVTNTIQLALSHVGGTAGGGRGNAFHTCGFSPDSSQVYYLTTDNLTDDDLEFRRVDVDGTNDTLILATSITDVASGFLPRISPDGTMIAYWLDFDAGSDTGLWSMDSDGSNNTKIWASSSGNDGFFGWSRDSEWLLYRDSVGPPFVETIYKIRPDGSDQTTLWTANLTGGEGSLTLSFGSYSVWNDDASGVVGKLDLYPAAATEPSREIGILSTDGSETWTPLSPSRITNTVSGAGSTQTGPIVNRDASRIYWLQGDGSQDTSMVVSTLMDGSDYRVDDDMTDSSTTPNHDDYVFNGFIKRYA